MLKLGDKTISKLYLGDKAISKAYLGEKLVFQAGGRFVESIVFDGASWINTDIVPQFGDKLEICGRYTDNVQTGAMFGAGAGDYQLIWLAVANTQRVYYKYFEAGGARVLEYTPNKTFFAECYADGSVSINGEQVLAPVTTLSNQTVNTNLFIGSRGGGGNPLTGFINFSKLIASDGTVKLGLRPYVDENGVACFKDVVTGNIFYNQGTGTLGYTE